MAESEERELMKNGACNSIHTSNSNKSSLNDCSGGGAKKKVLPKAKISENSPSFKGTDVKIGKNKRRSNKEKNVSKKIVAGTPEQEKSSEQNISSNSSEVTSDISLKLNSSDNLRNTKFNRRASVPNHKTTPQDTESTPSKSNSEKRNSKASERKFQNSQLRTKTPDCKNTPNKTPNSGRKSSSFQRVTKFEPYIPLFKVQQGLKRGEFIEGALRINPRNYEDAYVNSPDGKMDIYIGGMQDRNRAFNGDIVAVQVNPKQEWKILCDAIKDYEDKSGDHVIETVSLPTPTPSCKVHTPDRLSKSRPISVSSWNSSTHGERFPDTLKILGIDKLAQELGGLSMEKQVSPKRRIKRKGKLSQNSKDGNSEKTSTSYSQESSEDCLDKVDDPLSLEEKKGVDCPIPLEQTPQENCNLEVRANESLYPACDMSNIGTFDLEMHQKLDSEVSQNSNAWEMEDATLNIVVSPEELLSIDGDSLLKNDAVFKNNELVNSDSEIDGIIVPPGELSGDEFTDSASIGSTQSEHLEKVLEDAAFLASQQDADNNNVEMGINFNQNVINQLASTDYPAYFLAQNSITQRDKTLELDCKVQQNRIIQPISCIEIESDSVVCSAVSEVQLSKTHSSSDENDNVNPLLNNEYQNVESAKICDQPNLVSDPIIKSRRRKRKKQNKEKIKKIETFNGRLKNTKYDISKLTIDEIMKHPEWPRFIQKTGKVVHIFERKHSCIAAGHLKLLPDKNPKWALFSPNDSRVPRIMVPMSDCPQNFYSRHFDYTKVLFLAEVTEWNETSAFAGGHLIKSLGNTGDIVVETEGILVENGVDYSEFPEEVIKCLPQEEKWKVPIDEIKIRRDFRNECVFTIDPATARDMDDAVSCSLLPNGNYEVGVHIADVTYFIEQGTILDKYAESRSTSVYLVQKVIPMLPRLLCDNLCSLNPGQDRLTFSVVWEMSPEGEICQQWIGRSVINSCSKLSYEHAQSMLTNPGASYNPSEFPEIFGRFNLNDIGKRVYELHLLASKLREKRFDGGALRLDQVKLQFTLNLETGLPSGFNVFVHQESNKLIEELMLLANMTVAKHIYNSFPSLSLLRRHPPPQDKVMQDIVSMCESMGIIIDASSSKNLQSSMAHYMGDDYMSKARTELLMSLCSKPMNPAVYFCTGILEDSAKYHHYALNVPLYTHFTSPIRRYPDIIVHRVLGASLGYNPLPNVTPIEMEKCAKHCNDKKYNAKRVGEQSAEMFLAAFVREIGCVSAKAMVLNVMDHSFDCLILDMGVVKRVYCDKLPLLRKDFTRTHGVSRLNIFWKDPEVEGGIEQVLVIFALVDVLLSVEKDSLQIRVVLKKPAV